MDARFLVRGASGPHDCPRRIMLGPVVSHVLEDFGSRQCAFAPVLKQRLVSGVGLAIQRLGLCFAQCRHCTAGPLGPTQSLLHTRTLGVAFFGWLYSFIAFSYQSEIE